MNTSPTYTETATKSDMTPNKPQRSQLVYPFSSGLLSQPQHLQQRQIQKQKHDSKVMMKRTIPDIQNGTDNTKTTVN